MEMETPRILIAAPDAEERGALATAAGGIGLPITESDDGFEAFGRIVAGKYAAIVVDVRSVPSRMMPGRPMGIGLIEELQRNDASLLGRVVLIAEDASLCASLAGKVAAVVLKPVSPAALQRALDTALGSSAV